MLYSAETLLNLAERVEVDSTQLNSLIDNVVSAYTGALNDIMEEIHIKIIDADEPDVTVLEHYFLELSNCLYFVSERVEKLGIMDAISKLQLKEAYNNAYMNPKTDKAKPTVAELTAEAEGRTIYETAVNEVYSRAYKIMKNKIDAAYTMVSTLSKCISRRMSDTQLSGMQPAVIGRQVLNEEVI